MGEYYGDEIFGYRVTKYDANDELCVLGEYDSKEEAMKHMTSTDYRLQCLVECTSTLDHKPCTYRRWI